MSVANEFQNNNNPANSGVIDAPQDAHTVYLRKEGARNFQLQEAFKTLRSNTEFSGENLQVICVTSALPGDGKSTVSYNLACAFAESGKTTLLIDADLRKSVMRKYCRGGNPSSGLTHYLIGKKTYAESVNYSDITNLSVIFAGHVPPNPTELLGSKKFTSLVEKAREDFQVVIIDTPPIGSVIDSAIVAKVCDGIILVLKDGAISYRIAQRCKEQLDHSGTKLLGCVLNSVDLSSNRYYGKYYGKYYGSYYGK